MPSQDQIAAMETALARRLAVQGYIASTAVGRDAIAALLDAGFVLLPSGGEVSTQWGVRWHAVPNQDEWDDWGFSDEEHAREEMASSPTPSTLLRLRSITLPVEPVVSDNEEGTDG